MRYRITTVSLIVVLITTGFQTPSVSSAGTFGLPVFPGAEGFGTDTPAGRGGQIIKVTNLNDSGPGSFREALNTEGRRVIIFEVGGIIWLSRTLSVREPFVTIAGQTAPWPGITLAGSALIFFTHDVLVQHIYARGGDEPGGSVSNERDGIKAIGKGGNEVYNIVIDHCSFSWVVDKAITVYAAAVFDYVHDVTVSSGITC